MASASASPNTNGDEKADFLAAMDSQPEYAKAGFCVTEFHPPDSLNLDGVPVHFEMKEHPTITKWSVSLLDSQNEVCAIVIAYHTKFRHGTTKEEKYDNAGLIWRMCSMIRSQSQKLINHMDAELKKVPDHVAQFRIFMPGVHTTVAVSSANVTEGKKEKEKVKKPMNEPTK